MAARDKIRARVQPHLEPGEVVQAVVPCQTGPSPWFGGLSYWIVIFGGGFWIVVATDRDLVVFRASVWMPFKPKELDRRLPRPTTFGELKGLWGKSQVLGRPTHVHKRFQKDAAEADALAHQPTASSTASTDAAATATAATPAGWYPDPDDPSSQRYWDGSAWTDHRHPA